MYIHSKFYSPLKIVRMAREGGKAVVSPTGGGLGSGCPNPALFITVDVDLPKSRVFRFFSRIFIKMYLVCLSTK